MGSVRGPAHHRDAIALPPGHGHADGRITAPVREIEGHGAKQVDRVVEGMARRLWARSAELTEGDSPALPPA